MAKRSIYQLLDTNIRRLGEKDSQRILYEMRRTRRNLEDLDAAYPGLQLPGAILKRWRDEHE